MRNFEQRMEEIRNRSRTRMIRRRKVIAAVSSAFALCIALTGAFFWTYPAMDDAPATQSTNGYFMFSANTTVYRDNGDIYAFSTGGEEILSYIDTLDTGSAQLQQEYSDVRLTAGDAPADGVVYTFEITDALGNLRRFELAGGTLTDENTQIVYTLNSNQRLHLLRLLHIVN